MNDNREKEFDIDAGVKADKESKPWSKEKLVLFWKAIDKWTRDWIKDLIETVTRKRPVSTSYRFLVHQIEGRFARHEGPRTIILSSADSQDVSTEVLLMIAYFLNDELGKKVLLIDGSFGLSDLSERLGVAKEAGLSEFLYQSGHSLNNLIKPVMHNQLFLLPRGLANPQGARHIGRDIVSGMLADLNQFDYILIQQGAITQDTRYLVFAQEADLVLMYVEERQTLVTEFEANQKTFREYKIENVGFVMTGSE